MSKEFIDYLNKKIEEKLEEVSYPILKEVKEEFLNKFPELDNSKWKITYKPIEKFKFEILIDDIKILVKKNIMSGFQLDYSYRLILNCINCNKEIQEWINSINDIYNTLLNKNKCIECQLKSN